MMSAVLMVTVDYELFGDGSGCLDQCVVAPTEAILAISERYQVPVTLFVEALEFARMEQDPRSAAEGEAVARVRAQLQQAVARGHDVQLHLHPQWTEAAHTENGAWQVNLSKWRIGDLAYEEVDALIAAGKAWLEKLLCPAKSDYQCIAFRAGAWCIQPSHHVVRALTRHGFHIDSTVAPGLYNAGSGDRYDFRGAPARSWWHVSEDVLTAAAEGLIEVPIAVAEVPAQRRLLSVLKKKLSGRENAMAPGCHGSYRGPNTPWQALCATGSKLACLGKSMLDISTLRAEMLISIADQWRRTHQVVGGMVPIVAIGHSKNFSRSSEQQYVRFLQWVANDETMGSATYQPMCQHMPKVVHGGEFEIRKASRQGTDEL